ncbi:roundabout homolog 4 isoform X2 [Trachemys scripta elegans]|uniref:roundabout homolog 4 isoform X2 n=1 Tax=Trachemys scripta elegans TaxID=31138 RepID=UPI001556ADAE|nr:roundabout homolog 4 isoform X2 [Trachemys scripta elegans]
MATVGRIEHNGSWKRSKSHSEEFPPYIIDHPTDLVVRWDQPATLNCRVAGSPAPTIEWYRNGEYVETSKDNVYSQRTLLPDGSLFFLRLNQRKGQSDEGVYTCVAMNHLGTASSKNASLYIAALREDFRLQPSNLLVTVGEQVLLECAPPRGHPEPTISWKKDGVPISQKAGHYEVSSGKLLMVHAQRSDAGLYVCVASNQAGQRESKAALVSVLEKPTFTRRPNDIVAKFGSTVQLGCGVEGDPLPKVWWHKEHGELPWGRHEVDEENTLRIHYVTTFDSGRYICTAQNQVGTASAKASLTVQDPLDTGQREWPKDVPREMMDVQLYLDNSTALPSSPAVYLHWKVIRPSQHTEGHAVLYRSLLPVSTDWVEWKVPREHGIVIPALKRGYKYEFKVRPYAGKVYGPDSNVRHLWIPEEVPSAAPQHVTITAVEDGNGTALISWDPPPHHAHNGIIRGYKVWYLGNETHHRSNRTVDGGTHSLETVLLPAGVKYCIQVAAFNGAGLGVPSNATCSSVEPLVGQTARTPAVLSVSHILAVIRQPVFIASVGSLLWLVLMVLAVYLCQHHARHYSREQQHALGKGLCRYSSEDTIVKHAMDVSDSPWLADRWKATSCSKTFSSSNSSRSSSQLLWAETKDSLDFHRSTVSFDRPSQSSQIPAVPRGPDSSSLYRVLYVDLPAKDMQTFHRPPLPSTPGPHRRAAEPGGPTDPRLGPRYRQSLGVESSCARGAEKRGLWKPAGPGPPSLTLQGPLESSSKRELQQAHSTPVLSPSLPAYSTSPSRAPSTSSSGKRHAGKGEETKVLKTFSSPKLLQSRGSLHGTGTLPPPPAPPTPHGPQGQGMQPESRDGGEAARPFPAGELQPSTKDALRSVLPSPSLPYRAASPAPSLGDDGEAVLTPDQVAAYLELSAEAECQRHRQESTFSPPHTYGYICGPLRSELGAGPAPEEDDDPDAEGSGCQSMPFLHRYCRRPSSSRSEAEGSLGGSLLNGWGSVSEENFTSTRCSLVSSSDGSFLVDANFAQALAVAVDSFCFGLSPSEAEQAYPDFSPPASPLDGLLPRPERWEGVAWAGAEPLPLPTWEWSTGWLEDMEAKYSQRPEGTPAAEKPEGKAALNGTRPLAGPNGACMAESSSPTAGTMGECQPPCPAAHSPMPNSSAIPRRGEKTRVVLQSLDAGATGVQA